MRAAAFSHVKEDDLGTTAGPEAADENRARRIPRRKTWN